MDEVRPEQKTLAQRLAESRAQKSVKSESGIKSNLPENSPKETIQKQEAKPWDGAERRKPKESDTTTTDEPKKSEVTPVAVESKDAKPKEPKKSDPKPSVPRTGAMRILLGR